MTRVFLKDTIEYGEIVPTRETLIVAVSDNWVIAKDGDMPWGRKLKDDLAHFRKTTSGIHKAVVCGRKTAETTGYLPDRMNVVLSRNRSIKLDSRYKIARNIEMVRSLTSGNNVYIIGGGEIYNLFLPIINRMLVTHVRTIITGGDVFFPEISGEWKSRTISSFLKNDRNEFQFDIVEYTRKPQL